MVAKEGLVMFSRATDGGVGWTSRSADVLGCTAEDVVEGGGE